MAIRQFSGLQLPNEAEQSRVLLQARGKHWVHGNLEKSPEYRDDGVQIS
jgi:hypothetical protein